MPLHDWNRVQSVFLSVADLPPEDQARLLDTACAEDRELRAEIESLLESDRMNMEVVSTAIASEAALLFGAPTLIGGRLGAYRVVKEIGRGGMGAVYLAVRDDDQFDKQVAIKVVKRGMDTADVLGRFRHERQILANLDHPYIARLLDAGTTSDGLPFFVMDYVEGLPLDAFAAEHKLDIKARCQLFLRILEAVAHAHRSSVVHRDLKPANIFVKSDGTPKLLDFGVAKLVAGDSNPGVTAMAPARPFTPEYASPEQVRGFVVTAATDIYSLGAVFYELLTGQRAQPIATLTPSEVERVICRTEVTRPSLVAPDIDRDLDNIVLMAMRKETDRRYQSVDQLSEDVRRYLSGRPVLARQDSLWYRTSKFAQRNRLQIAGAALIFASLVIALLVSLFQSRQAQAARHIAEDQRTIADRERARAETGFKQAEAARAAESQQRLNADRQRDEAVLQRARAEQRLTQLFGLAETTLFEIHDTVAKLPGSTEARQSLVKTTLDYLETIEKQRGLDDMMRIALSAAYGRIAAIQGDPSRPSLGDFAGARASYLRAETLLTPLIARKKNDPAVLIRWIEVEGGLAELELRHFDHKRGIERSLSLVPIAHRLGELLPSDPIALKQEGAVHASLVQALVATDAAAASKHGDQAIAIITALTSRFPEDRDLKQNLGSTLATVAGTYRQAGELPRAAEYYEKSIAIREGLLKAEPHSAPLQRSLLVTYGNYAALLGIPWSINLGRPAEARKYCEKSVALARSLAGADPQDKTARYDLAMSLGRLGMVDPDPGQIAGSLKSLEEALTIFDPVIKANPNSPNIVSQVGTVREYAGYRLRSLGQTAAAAEQFQRALSELEAMFKANPGQPPGIPFALETEEALAGILATQGDREAALSHANHAVERAEKNAATSPNRAAALGHLGQAYFELASVERSLGDWDRASEAADHSMSVWGTIQDAAILSLHKEAREQLPPLMHEIAARGVAKAPSK